MRPGESSMKTTNQTVNQNDSRPVRVALVIINRQLVRSWLDSGLVDSLVNSGRFEFTVFAEEDVFSKLPDSVSFRKENLGTIKVTRFSKHMVGMGYVEARFKSKSFRFKLVRGFLPDTWMIRKNGTVLERAIWLFRSVKRLVGNTIDNRMTLLYYIKPFRIVLRRNLVQNRELQDLPEVIRLGNYEWLVMPVASSIGFTTDFLVGARNAGIRSLLAIDNWDHLTGKSIYPIKPDYFTVMGRKDIEHAVAIHGCDPTTVLPFGLPRFDVYRRLNNTPPRSKSGQKKRVLYCGFSLAHSEKVLVDRLTSFLVCKYGSDSVEVIYRPHPGPAPRYDGYEISNPNVIVTDHGDVTRTAMPAMDETFVSTILDADVIVGAPTTLILEALILGKDCVLDLTIDDFHRTTAGNSALNHTHMIDLTEITEVMRGNSIMEVIEAVDELLSRVDKSTKPKISDFYDVGAATYEIQLASFLLSHASHSCQPND